MKDVNTRGSLPPTKHLKPPAGSGPGYLLKTAVSVLASTVRLRVSFMPPFITVSVTLSVLSASSSPSELASMATLAGAATGHRADGHTDQNRQEARLPFRADPASRRSTSCLKERQTARWLLPRPLQPSQLGVYPHADCSQPVFPFWGFQAPAWGAAGRRECSSPPLHPASTELTVYSGSYSHSSFSFQLGPTWVLFFNFLIIFLWVLVDYFFVL